MKFTVDLYELEAGRVYKYEAKVWVAHEEDAKSYYVGHAADMSVGGTRRKAKKLAKDFLKRKPGLFKTYSLEIN